MSTSSAFHRGFDSPAKYRICVRGKLDPAWSDRLEGMSIRQLSTEDDMAITVLEGELMDQAALTGVLTTLYNLHYSLLFLEYLGAGHE